MILVLLVRTWVGGRGEGHSGEGQPVPTGDPKDPSAWNVRVLVKVGEEQQGTPRPDLRWPSP